MPKRTHPGSIIVCTVFLACVFLWRAAESAGGYGALPVCEIRGTIADVKTVKTAPLPSPLSEAETFLSVRIEDRKARYGDNMPCTRLTTAQETRTYKLCSNRHVSPGDKIGGTEASATGPESPVGCLFDLVVLPAQNQDADTPL